MAAATAQQPRRLAATTGTVLILDLGTKQVAGLTLPPATRVGPFFRVANPEFSLGSFSSTRSVMLLLMAAGALAVLVIARRVLGAQPHSAAPLGLVLGGALANTLDRALDNAVTDFIIAGPIVINLADVAVVLGLVAIGVLWLAEQRRHSPNAPTVELSTEFGPEGRRGNRRVGAGVASSGVDR